MAGLQTSDLDIGLLDATQITGVCPLKTILIYIHRKELRALSNILFGPLGLSPVSDRFTASQHVP